MRISPKSSAAAARRRTRPAGRYRSSRSGSSLSPTGAAPRGQPGRRPGEELGGEEVGQQHDQVAVALNGLDQCVRQRRDDQHAGEVKARPQRRLDEAPRDSSEGSERRGQTKAWRGTTSGASVSAASLRKPRTPALSPRAVLPKRLPRTILPPRMGLPVLDAQPRWEWLCAELGHDEAFVQEPWRDTLSRTTITLSIRRKARCRGRLGADGLSAS